jgi:TonB dependent receptor
VAPNLDPDTYMVRVESKGFKTFTREGMQLGVGQDARVDVALEPGEQTQTITVTEALPLVDTTNATLTGSIDNQTVNEVPLNGRNYVNLLSLRPGFVNAPGGGATKQTAMGMRELDNFFLVDGVNNYDWATGQQVINGYALAGDASTILPLDAIQEMTTEQNPKAEFGWKPGMQVNIGLKSGTNTLHGSAYAFGRDGAWDAKNFFQPTNVPAPPLSVEQFGATLGGPLKKDKIFWYIGFEAQKLSVGVSPLINSPIDAPMGGNLSLSMVDACNAVGRANVTALSAKLAGLPPGSCTPLPATTSFENLFPTNPGTQFTLSPQLVVPSGLFALSDNNNTYSGLAKVDYHLNDKNTLSGMFFIGQGDGEWDDNPAAVSAPWSQSVLPFHNRVGSGSWTWTPNSSWVNEFKGSYTHVYAPDLSADRTANPASPWGFSNGVPTGYGLNTGVTDSTFFGLPLIYITNFTNLGGGNWPRFVGPNGYTEFLDHISYLRGKHAFKFGGEMTLVGSTGGQVQDPKGRINFKNGGGFTSLQNFLLGNIGPGTAIFEGSPVRHVHNQDYALFVQDDYRVLPTLTLNFGLRYELQTVIHEDNNLLGNFDPNSATGFVQVGKGETSPYNGDHNNFSPRIGFAWDVRGDGKTVIRSGASIIHEFQPLNGIMSSAGGLGVVPTGAQLFVGNTQIPNIGTITSGTVIATSQKSLNDLNTAWLSNGATPIFAGTSQLACSDSVQCPIPAFSRNLEVPYFETWNLDVQRMLTKDLSLEVAYLGNHGVKLWGLRDINAPPVGGGPLPYGTKFPYLSNINYLSNMDKSHYNALQVVLTQRTSHGLSFTAAYTYGHALDDDSANVGATNPLNNANPALQYGNSDYDIRHHFTLDVTYALPGMKSPGQILQGWEISSITTLQSGTPWGIEDTSNDFSGTGEVNNPYTYGETWNFFGKPSDFTASTSGIPYFPGPAINGVPFPSQCVANADAMQLSTYGCYMKGSSVLVPPNSNTYGTAGRNIFRNTPFETWDFSILKNMKFKERLSAQFRAEVFNVLNHPIFGGVDAGHLVNNDPSVGSNTFGQTTATADLAAGNPVMGSGSNRVIQLGLKLAF